MTQAMIACRAPTRPLFSICIPQYNRTSFLLYALERLNEQTCREFEVCLSDDCSTDGRAQEILDYLAAAGMAYAYKRQSHNLRYDGNLRAAIGLAEGRYALLMGNDDCLAAADTLERLRDAVTLAWSASPAVVITNYRDFETGQLMRRVRQTSLTGGVETAIRTFRNFSFVSGIMLDTQGAQAAATAKWDGSEMYQMYIGCRLLAQGGTLLQLDEIAVCQGIRLPDQAVDSYAGKPRLDPCPIVERPLTLGSLGRVVIDALEPYVAPSAYGRVARSVFGQILGLTFPFWLFEYRRVQSWNYAIGVALGMRPRNLFRSTHVGWLDRTRLSLLYAAVSAVGLLLPLGWFERLYPRLYALAKRQ